MDCLKCGACCEEFAMPYAKPETDEERWLIFHAKVIDGWMHFDAKCTKLTAEGRCSCYDHRPKVCKDYQPGCPECLAVVARRRTPDQIEAIKEGGAPPRPN